MLAPRIVLAARRPRMRAGGAFVPDGRAALPAVDDASAIDRGVAADAAESSRAACAQAQTDDKANREQRRNEKSHGIPLHVKTRPACQQPHKRRPAAS